MLTKNHIIAREMQNEDKKKKKAYGKRAPKKDKNYGGK